MALRNTLLRRTKYRLFSRLPGAKGLKYGRKLRRLYAPEAQRQFREALAGATGKLCIDLGANMGLYSREMAATADHVYAFEPDPWTVARLRQNLSDLKNVEVVEAAALDRNGEIDLYRTADFEEAPEAQSLSSSVIADKLNIDTSKAIKTRCIDFAEFLQGLDRDVAVIKMDIEGGEVPVLERLLDHPVLSRIGHIFVETHENRIPALAKRTRALRLRTTRMTQPVINMNWI